LDKACEEPEVVELRNKVQCLGNEQRPHVLVLTVLRKHRHKLGLGNTQRRREILERDLGKLRVLAVLVEKAIARAQRKNAGTRAPSTSDPNELSGTGATFPSLNCSHWHPTFTRALSDASGLREDDRHNRKSAA
jgi:hypothetical protein